MSNHEPGAVQPSTEDEPTIFTDIPSLLAKAWDEGMQAMYESTNHEWPPIPEQNPYRPTHNDKDKA